MFSSNSSRLVGNGISAGEWALLCHRSPRGTPVPQTEEQKIRSRLRSYERKLQKEKKEHGFYRDGAGRRYLIGPHYMLLGENDGALGACSRCVDPVCRFFWLRFWREEFIISHQSDADDHGHG